MKNILKITILFALLTLVLLTTVSCKNILGDLLGGNEENTTPETTTQPHAHAFGEWTTTKNATCTEKGQQERVCVCGEKELQEVGALGHTEVVDTAVAPTCTTNGLTAGSHCSVCGEIFIAQETVPAIHDWMQTALLESATCFTQGKEHRVCRVCGVEEDALVEPLKHNFVLNEETQLHNCTLCNGILFAGHVYAVFEEACHWFDAYELCEDMGGHLVTVTSKHEQAVIDYLMNSELRTMGAYWIGGIRLSDGFHWITEEPFEYQNWKSGQPNFNRDNQHFIRVESSLLSTFEKPGLWNDDDYQYQYGFICEFDLGITDSKHTFTEWETIIEPTCWKGGEQYRVCTYCGAEETEVLPKVEHNFVLNEESGIEMCEHCNAAKHNGHIYMLFTDTYGWFEAYARCEALGGHLATITSENEQRFIASYCSSFNLSEHIWIGGYSDGKQWHWVTNETFEYTNWKSGEPNNGSGGCEWFVQFRLDGTWNDLSPSGIMPYLCEFECEE